MSWTTPAPRCDYALGQRHPTGCARVAVASHDGVHAWHTRRLADLPVAGRRVTIELHVRLWVPENLAHGR
jgi:hypothetical protein